MSEIGCEDAVTATDKMTDQLDAGVAKHSCLTT